MNKRGNGLIIGILVVVLILGLLGYFGSFLLRTAPTSTVVPTSAAAFGDIDRSGAANEEDRIMVRNHIGCIKAQPCWNTTVGKTKDGDNPIYVFDLDLNKDGAITQADVDLIK